MTALQILAMLLALAAAASYINHRFLRLPATIGLMALTLAGSLAFVVMGKLGVVDLATAEAAVRAFDFDHLLLHGMLDTFWEMLDEVMNALLFVLIGLQIIAIKLDWAEIAVGALAIVAALGSRFAAIAALISALRMTRRFSAGVVEILTWCGLRGGISIALALSLPALPHKDLILTATYMVVVFSILVQGLTIGHVIRARGRNRNRALQEVSHV